MTALIHACIEIPALSTGVKYEIDKKTGHIVVDRFLKAAMHYPCNYGYITHTLGGDNDALDVLVITPCPLKTGVYIECRPVAVLNMDDEQGEDAKIIAVPSDTVSPYYRSVQSAADIERLHPGILESLRHFFSHYKDLDEGKWVNVKPGFETAQAAQQRISAAQQAYQNSLN